MLSSVLNSEIAVEVNISIMRAFVAMRRLIANPPDDKHEELRQEITDHRQADVLRRGLAVSNGSKILI